MINSSLGDMALAYSQRQRNVSIRQDITRLSTELASGQVSDARQVLKGNYNYLADLERKMADLSSFKVATSEAAHFSDAMQTSLSDLNDIGTKTASTLLTASSGDTGPHVAEAAREARGALEAMIGRFNTQTAGRHLFSGDATDTPPLPDVDTFLTALKTAIAGAATPDDMLADAKTWFDDPAGFAATLYGGSGTGMSPMSLSRHEKVSLDIKATDPELREVLRITALAALTEDPAFGLTGQQKLELYGKTGQQLLFAQDDIIAVQSRIGFAEARIEEVTSRNAAEMTSLEFARNKLLAIDPYETATRLEEVQFQLESLYSVTVKLSRLNLVNFL